MPTLLVHRIVRPVQSEQKDGQKASPNAPRKRVRLHSLRHVSPLFVCVEVQHWSLCLQPWHHVVFWLQCKRIPPHRKHKGDHHTGAARLSTLPSRCVFSFSLCCVNIAVFCCSLTLVLLLLFFSFFMFLQALTAPAQHMWSQPGYFFAGNADSSISTCLSTSLCVGGSNGVCANNSVSVWPNHLVVLRCSHC